MRMRRLKWAPDFLAESNIVVKDPAKNKGKWKTVFNKDVLHLEIGTGKGDYLIKMSDMYKDVAWLGIEKNESVCALAVRKSGETSDNRLFIQNDAENILDWFEENEIDVIHMNFSDPWPKKKTSKRRLSHASFLEKYKTILKEDGEIQMKTDNSKLFEFSIIEFLNNGFYLEEFYVDYRREEHDEDAITEYEQKFMDKGNPIYRAVFKQKCEVK